MSEGLTVKPIQEELTVFSLREQRAFENNDPGARSDPQVYRDEDAPMPSQSRGDQGWIEPNPWDAPSPPEQETRDAGPESEIAALRAEVAQMQAAIASMVDKQQPSPKAPAPTEADPVTPPTVETPSAPEPPKPPSSEIKSIDSMREDAVNGAISELESVEFPRPPEHDVDESPEAPPPDSEPQEETTSEFPEFSGNWMEQAKEGREVEEDPATDQGLPVAISREGMITFVGAGIVWSVYTLIEQWGGSMSFGDFLAIEISCDSEGKPTVPTAQEPTLSAIQLIDYGANVGGMTERGEDGKQTKILFPVARFLQGNTWAVFAESGIYDFFHYEDEDGECVWLPIRII